MELSELDLETKKRFAEYEQLFIEGELDNYEDDIIDFILRNGFLLSHISIEENCIIIKYKKYTIRYRNNEEFFSFEKIKFHILSNDDFLKLYNIFLRELKIKKIYN